MGSILDDFKGAFNKPNNGLMQLIFINIAVFVALNVFRVFGSIFQIGFIYDLLANNLYLSADLSTVIFKPWTVITYFFCQVGIFHLLSNMLGLYWFGRIIDDLLGSNRLIGIYVWGGIIGGAAYLLSYNILPHYKEMATYSILLGSSGAVFAIVVGAATLTPDYRFNLIFLGPVKIVWIATAYVFFSFIGSVGTNAGGNIAHLGGALMGYIMVSQLRKGNELAKPVITVITFFKALFKPRPKMKVSYKSKSKTSAQTSPKSASSGVSQKEIDVILDKISESGYESLTKEEKKKLFSASQKK